MDCSTQFPSQTAPVATPKMEDLPEPYFTPLYYICDLGVEPCTGNRVFTYQEYSSSTGPIVWGQKYIVVRIGDEEIFAPTPSDNDHKENASTLGEFMDASPTRELSVLAYENSRKNITLTKPDAHHGRDRDEVRARSARLGWYMDCCPTEELSKEAFRNMHRNQQITDPASKINMLQAARDNIVRVFKRHRKSNNVTFNDVVEARAIPRRKKKASVRFAMDEPEKTTSDLPPHQDRSQMLMLAIKGEMGTPPVHHDRSSLLMTILKGEEGDPKAYASYLRFWRKSLNLKWMV